MLLSWILKILSLLGLVIHISNPISFTTDEFYINSMPQKAYTLSIDSKNPFIEVSSLLSHDILYGFEKTSAMSARSRSLFAVNGMYYNELGVPYGILIINGQVILTDSINTPTLLINKKGDISIEDIQIRAKISSKNKTISILGTNREVPDEEWVLFDRIYGKTTRVERNSVNYIIKDNIIIDIIKSDKPVSLDLGDYVLTNVNKDGNEIFKIGEVIDIKFEIDKALEGEISQGVQTGGWLVKDGKNIAKEYEPFIGYTTGLNPRTLIGVTKDKRLIIKVIDGRNPNISAGVTGFQGADLMIKEGCEYAAYLDGGASSTIVQNKGVINTPSNKEEREVAHSISIGLKYLTKTLVFRKKDAY